MKIPGAQRGRFTFIDVKNLESMVLRKCSRVRSGGLQKVDLDERKATVAQNRAVARI